MVVAFHRRDRQFHARMAATSPDQAPAALTRLSTQCAARPGVLRRSRVYASARSPPCRRRQTSGPVLLPCARNPHQVLATHHLSCGVCVPAPMSSTFMEGYRAGSSLGVSRARLASHRDLAGDVVLQRSRGHRGTQARVSRPDQLTSANHRHSWSCRTT
jgi:hypothetical protein